MAWRRWAPGIAALAILAAACWPILGAGFCPWDDRLYTAENPLVKNGLSLPAIVGAFTSTWENNWSPLFWIFLAAQVSLAGGIFASVFHAVSVLLCLGNAVLLAAVARRFSLSLGVAVVVTALYALHPLRVEAVAWISAQKHLLAAAFLLVSLLFYQQGAGRERLDGKSLVLSLLAYAASLLSSQIGVGFPVFLFLWEACRGSRSAFRDAFFRSAGYFLLAAAAAAVTLWVNWRPAAQAVPWFDHPLAHRLLQAAGSLGWQAGAWVWPAGLAGFYPWPARQIGLYALGGVLVLLAAAGLIWKFRKTDPLLVAGLGGFLACFFPVSGLLAMPIEFTADRLTYVPGLFLALALGAGLQRAWGAGARWPVYACGAAALVLAPLSFRQAGFWRTERRIVDRTLSLYPDSVPARINDATLAGLEHDPEEALERFREIRASHPLYEVVWSNEMTLLLQAGRTDEAIGVGREAVRHIPASVPLNYRVGVLLLEADRPEEALEYLRRARGLSPQSVQPAWQLARALVRTGRIKEALPILELLTLSLQGDPDYWDLRGEAHDRNGDWQQAAAARKAAASLRRKTAP
jgi:Putative Zn-dependent protease, contains TPR repeats